MRRSEAGRFFAHRPFQPFRLRMVGGQHADILTPESIVGPHHIAFLNPRGVIEVLAIEFVESIEPLPARRSNGRARRRRAGR